MMVRSLFLNRLSTTPKLLITNDDDEYLLWKKKKRNVIKLCCKQGISRISSELQLPVSESSTTTTSNMSAHLPSLTSLGLKEITLNRHTKSSELVDSSHGLGIVRFLRGKVFLITGATGFLAKVLIEKILRTVPDVGKIYILIKAKDKEEAMQRIKTEIADTELFKNLLQTHGKSHQKYLLSKLVPIVGNLCEPNLGIDMEIADRAANEVDVIINSAGNTTFDERYDVALNTNTLGPCRFLSFAKRCKNLKLFLHISTAYVNGKRRGIVMEKPFYLGDSISREKAASEIPRRSFPLLDVEAEIKMAVDASKKFQDDVGSQKMIALGLERARLYGWQDTYVFTKAMGEMMIENQRGDVPVVILRPSVIESTYKEPISGWIEGIRMMDPLTVAYAKGLLTGFPVDGKAAIDIVPADMVVNAILAATVKHAAKKKQGLSVYHVGSSVVNPILLQDFFCYNFDYFFSSPFMDLKKKPINIQRLKLFDSMDDFHSHIETEADKKSAVAIHEKNFAKRLRKSLDIAKHLANIYQPYMFYEGRFDDSNTQKLLKEMSDEEKRSFGFDAGSIDWKYYICNIHIPGVLTHALNGRGM
ncbi:Fatty acyl-coa reductase [Thalictrum thalictroides]|uniref:Fatty acyl-CoA reductase n=1 Tax=Thalictrum thalictroides TaxID=46969 RepID=A0A7J6VR11_THATH|nr:Fatty acyl-coa reductase [Thalictrum thalictroides]